MKWLADKLVAIESGKKVRVVADVHGVRGQLEGSRKEDWPRPQDADCSQSPHPSRPGTDGHLEQDAKAPDRSPQREVGVKTLQLRLLSTSPKAFVFYKKPGLDREGVVENNIRRGPGA